MEVQERLDGRVLVSHRGTILTPGEAPPLAAVLRAHADAGRAKRDAEVETVAEREAPRESHPRQVWYEDSATLQRHRELIRAGMERVRREGRPIGRPRLVDQVDAQFVGERRSQGESWRQIALDHPPVRSTSGRMVKPSIGSIRRAVETPLRQAVVLPDQITAPTSTDLETRYAMSIT